MANEAAETQFTTDIDRSAEVTVVKCHGFLVASTAHLLYREVHQLIPETKRIVLDLNDLAHIDSMGIGTLVRLYVSAKSGKCNLQLMNVGGRVKQVLGITNLLSVFAAAEDHNIPIH